MKIIGLVFIVTVILMSGAERSEADNSYLKSSLKLPGPGHVQIIKSKDGSTNIGRITAVTADTVVFATGIGTMNIPIASIQSIEEVPESSIREGKFWFPDPNTTRLFFAPTGRMLKKGSGYIADYYLFFPAANYGFTDRFSFGGGCSIIPAGSIKTQIYYITPKIGLKQSEKLNVAAGALVLKFPDFDDEDVPLLSVLYGVGTYGSADRSVTLALGYGMEGSELAARPMIVLGGESRLLRRMALITENWVVPGLSGAVVSLGCRFFGEGLSTDLAIISAVGEEVEETPWMPYIDFVFNF